MQGLATVFFVVFALILAGIYLGIRRHLAPPGLVAAIGVILSVIVMTLMSLAQNNMPLQAVIVGLLLGGVFSGATLTIAWYFERSELQARARAQAYSPDNTQAEGSD